MRVMNKRMWPYQVRVQKGNSDDIYKWCEEKLYKGNYQDPLTWYYNASTSTWCFKRGKDYTMFCLRWS